jgi:hypothetical protein
MLKLPADWVQPNPSTGSTPAEAGCSYSEQETFEGLQSQGTWLFDGETIAAGFMLE